MAIVRDIKIRKYLVDAAILKLKQREAYTLIRIKLKSYVQYE